MAIPTTNAEMLAGVKAAVQAIEDGAQEYWIGSRKVKKADYAALVAERTRLIAVVDRENNGCITLASWD